MGDLTGTIQGYDAVLSFMKDDWVPFLCATDFTLSVKADVLPIKTVGDGIWKKNTYQNLSYTIALSGLLKFDDTNWTGWDMLDNMLNFNHIEFRISFNDENGNLISVQGECMVDATAFGVSVGNLVTDDFNLTGNGALEVFDGLIPCDTSIDSITVTNTAGSDLIAHINYTFTGAVNQVKYRLDGIGQYTFANAGTEIDIGTTIGAHVIEIIPVCLNGFEGETLSQAFTMTKGLSCAVVVSALSATPTGNNVLIQGELNSDPPGIALKYTLDGGATWKPVTTGITLPFGFTINLPIGNYTIQVVPTCANGVDGTGDSTSFSVAGGAGSSVINYSYVNAPTGNSMQIYVNGVLTVNLSNANASGSFNVPAGQSVRAVLSSTQGASLRDLTLTTTDSTTSTIINNQNSESPASLQYTFTPAGDTYLINGTVSP